MPIVLDGTNGISTPDVESAGPISGTTGTFSGVLRASGVATNIYPLVFDTAKASTSGTSIDFTGIPSWVRRVTVMFSGVSTNGSSLLQIQIGDAGGFETSGYTSTASYGPSAGMNTGVVSTGFILVTSGMIGPTTLHSGLYTLTKLTGNLYAGSGNLIGAGVCAASGGSKELSETFDRVRITTVNGTDAFDAGSINIMYE